jgi:rod shape determining protein RodA
MIRKAVADYPLALIALLLTAYGIAVVYSAGQTEVPNAAVANAWIRQLTWLAVGMTAFLIVTRMSVRFLEWAALTWSAAGCCC